ncbi:hypothetical protein CYMTET_33591 [Cymbomonas tetramitiformis]|uniref:Uncharacterized protein n=1 Tax=Cymbomonas tetramitiformis TaxID=36881 RepID=A0AAE0FCT3_9CHLO|nr:hypothetical protein CYMTET_33591 [Cymbomonas tetramitiformis]
MSGGDSDVPLTPYLIEEASGERLEDVVALEIIFTQFSCIPHSTLERVTKLRELCILHNGLRTMPDFTVVRHTLTSLNLSFQSLSSMHGIGSLPNLSELYLNNNAITRVEGIEGCRELQRLWLHSNKISTVTTMASLSNLRELWLQSNAVSNLTCLEGLVSLEVLALAGNPIAKLHHLEPLAYLPALRDLSLQASAATSPLAACLLMDGAGKRGQLVRIQGSPRVLRTLEPLDSGLYVSKGVTTDPWIAALRLCPRGRGELTVTQGFLKDRRLPDPHFMQAPIAVVDGYRELVVRRLGQVEMLDGTVIHERERQGVEDSYLRRVLDFNDSVEQLKRRNVQRLQELEAAQARSKAASSAAAAK